MKKEFCWKFVIWVFFILASSPELAAKEVPTLLASKTLNLVLAHTSGDLAHQHIRRISQFHRYAAGEGYRQAADYVVGVLKSYGFDDARIEEFPADGKAMYYMWKSFEGWDGEFGEVWIVEPFKERIASFAEAPISLCRNSQSAQVIAELVFVGSGVTPADYEGRDVRGKIVLASGSAGAVHEFAVFDRGALGVISYQSDHPLDNADLVCGGSINPYEKNGKRSAFGFTISYRKGEELRRWLESGKKLTVRAEVKASLRPNKYYVVSATIPGTDPNAEEFLFIAHLCHYDPGANDNASGAASLLEIARAIITMISSGDVAPPRSTIRFLWVPEMSGSYAYAWRHPDIIARSRCGINLDMVGSYLNKNNSGFYIHNTPHSLPHFINDVTAHFADYVGAVCNQVDYYNDYYDPILSLSGSRDGFRYKVLPFMGGSDHKIFNDALIDVPMVFFNVWPDAYYHTNQDTVDKTDPTTLRRGIFIAACSAVFVSGAKVTDALSLASEVHWRGLERLSQDIKKAFALIEKNVEKDLALAHKEAQNIIFWAIQREKKNIRSIQSLENDSAILSEYLANIISSLAGRERGASQDVLNYYRSICAQRNIKPMTLKPTQEELAAEKIIPARNENLKGPLGTAILIEKLGDSARPVMAKIFRDERVGYEIFNFIDGKNSILDIRNAVSAEFEPVPLQEIKEIMEALSKAEIISLRRAPNIAR